MVLGLFCLCGELLFFSPFFLGLADRVFISRDVHSRLRILPSSRGEINRIARVVLVLWFGTRYK